QTTDLQCRIKVNLQVYAVETVIRTDYKSSLIFQTSILNRLSEQPQTVVGLGQRRLGQVMIRSPSMLHGIGHQKMYRHKSGLMFQKNLASGLCQNGVPIALHHSAPLSKVVIGINRDSGLPQAFQ